MKRRPPNNRLIPVGLRTRIAAIQIDLLLFWGALLLLRLIFSGSVYAAESDLFSLSFIAIPFYFWASNRFSGATLGQRILGYKIIAIQGSNPLYGLRVLYGTVACFLGLLTLAANHHINDGIYWWDRKSNTRAVPLAYHHRN